MNRRNVIAGALASVVASSIPAQADPAFVVNDWTDGNPVPQIVTRSEIRLCTFVNNGYDHDCDWVSIDTHDGRTITSELSRSQDLKLLLRQLSSAGVPIVDLDTTSVCN